MLGLMQNRVPANQALFQHLDRCLACRACERVCPSGVKYGRLLDGVRAFIPTETFSNRKSAFHVRLLHILGSRGNVLNLLGYGLWLYQQSGVQWLARKMGLLRFAGFGVAEHELPRVPSLPHWREYYPAKGKHHGDVILFLGCLARFSDVETLKAAIYILNKLGYAVHVPQEQGCCGALHLHAGDHEKAMALVKRNLNAFSRTGEKTILSTVSGCGAMLHEYGELLDQDKCSSLHFQDINTFLAQAEGWEQCSIEPLGAKVAVHDPCTLRNVLRGENFPYQLLAKIPGLQIEALEGNDQCCGAAGLYHLEQPEMAGLLRDDKIKAIRKTGAKLLVTSNIGCAMWLAQEAGIEIVHPVVLLARQMGFSGHV